MACRAAARPSQGIRRGADGPTGLFDQLSKNVRETAQDAGIVEHPGNDSTNQTAGAQKQLSLRNRARTLFTEVGPVEIHLLREIYGSLDPVVVRRRQRRLTGVDRVVLSLTDVP